MAKRSDMARTLKIVPALTARTQLGQILRRVRQNHERFVVDKRGEPQARDYECRGISAKLRPTAYSTCSNSERGESQETRPLASARNQLGNQPLPPPAP